MTRNPFVDLETPTEEQYLFCIRCGLCLATCPTYRASLKETESPRGRVMLIRKALEGELELTSNFNDQMQKCMACLACNTICPVGIKPADLALNMRYVAEQVDPSGWKGKLFGGLLPHPRRMEWGTLPLRLYQNLGLRWLANTLRVTRVLPAQLRDLERQLPQVPGRPLRSRLPEVIPPSTSSGRSPSTSSGRSPSTSSGRSPSTSSGRSPSTGFAQHPERSEWAGRSLRVGFFLGCAQNLLFAEASAASARVLARNGCEVVTPRDVQCCGMPAIGYGRQEIMREMAKHNIALFERLNVDVIVTDCATCGSTLKEYGHYLAREAEWAERARAFSDRVRDVSEFLAEIPLEKPRGRIDGKVTYHDPCHLVRGQGVAAQPRQLLGMIDGLELVEMEEADWCCGSAGSQLITHYEDSLAILERKIDHVQATGADYVASGCPGCQMQLSVGLKRRGLQRRMQVVHPVLLLDRAYQDENH
jgi:glycolate oxidase iron-sulfur subunit